MKMEITTLIQEQNELLKVYKAEIAEKSFEAERLKDLLNNNNSKLQSINRRNEFLEVENVKLAERANTAQNQSDRFFSERNQGNDRNQLLQRQINHLKEQIIELESENEELQDTIEELENKNTELDEEIDDLQDQIIEEREEGRELSNDLKAYKCSAGNMIICLLKEYYGKIMKDKTKQNEGILLYYFLNQNYEVERESLVKYGFKFNDLTDDGDETVFGEMIIKKTEDENKFTITLNEKDKWKS